MKEQNPSDINPRSQSATSASPIASGCRGGFRQIPRGSRDGTIHRAPNNKFYVLWQEQVFCASNGCLHYFETEDEARAFLIEYAADDLIDASFA